MFGRKCYVSINVPFSSGTYLWKCPMMCTMVLLAAEQWMMVRELVNYLRHSGIIAVRHNVVRPFTRLKGTDYRPKEHRHAAAMPFWRVRASQRGSITTSCPLFLKQFKYFPHIQKRAETKRVYSTWIMQHKYNAVWQATSAGQRKIEGRK